MHFGDIVWEMSANVSRPQSVEAIEAYKKKYPYFDLNFFEVCPINNKAALVQIMAWRRTGDTPLFEPMIN